MKYIIFIVILQCYLFSNIHGSVIPRNLLRGASKIRPSVSIRDAPIQTHEGIFTDTPPIQRKRSITALELEEQKFNNLMNKVVRYNNNYLRGPSEKFTNAELDLLEEISRNNDIDSDRSGRLIKKVLGYKLNEDSARPSDVFTFRELRELQEIAAYLEYEEAGRKPQTVYEFLDLVQ